MGPGRRLAPVGRPGAGALVIIAVLCSALVAYGKGPPPRSPSPPALPAIEGTNQGDHLVGTARAEQITGYLGDDRIEGGGGDDFVDAREGNDRIQTPAGPGAAVLHGGRGDDWILARGAGADALHGMGGRDWLRSGSGADSLFGGPGDDLLVDRIGDNHLRGQGGRDRLESGAGDDVLAGEFGADRLDAGAGDDLLDGGPGYDTVSGGPGNDRLVDGSQGANLLEGGAGDDVIESAPQGMDRVRCGEGRDSVAADLLDIVSPECELVERAPRQGRPGAPAPDAVTLTEVRSLDGALIGTTGYPLGSPDAQGPLRLLWVNDGYTYLAARYGADDACFVAVEPSGGSRVGCGFGPRGTLIVRRIEGERFRWFALVPRWARSLSVGRRIVPITDGVAVFVGGRHLGPVVVRGDGREASPRVP